jgi:hypothetical protein
MENLLAGAHILPRAEIGERLDRIHAYSPG